MTKGRNLVTRVVKNISICCCDLRLPGHCGAGQSWTLGQLQWRRRKRRGQAGDLLMMLKVVLLADLYLFFYVDIEQIY